jgi:UDP-N-acetylglucosamine:LPS N-acetylglucosamine transferase
MTNEIKLTFEQLEEYVEELEDDYDYIHEELEAFKQAAEELGILDEIQAIVDSIL